MNELDQNHFKWIKKALRLAHWAAQRDEVPVGAIILYKGRVLSVGLNKKEGLQSPLAHAEMIAIERASKKLKSWRLEECELYVTLEPCIMCSGAILQSRFKKVIFGALDPKGGGVQSCYQLLQDGRLNHRVLDVTHWPSEECGQVLSDFFKKKRIK